MNDQAPLPASIRRCFHANDTGLRDLIRGRLERTDGPPLSQTSRNKFVTWLEAGHREFRRIEQYKSVEEQIRWGDFNWKDMDTVLQQNGIIWWAPGIIFALRQTLVDVEELGFRHLFTLLVTYERSANGRVPKEQEVSIYSSGDHDPTVAAHVFDLLCKQRCFGLVFSGYDRAQSFCLPAKSLAEFLFGPAPSNIRFCSTRFTEEHCQALSRSRRSLELFSCSLDDFGRSIFEQVAQNRGPYGLKFAGRMQVDMQALGSALQQTKSLTGLSIFLSLTNFDWNMFCSDLQRNRSLTALRIFCTDGHPKLAESVWCDLFLAVRNHPTLQILRLAHSGRRTRHAELPAEERTRRTRAVVDMAKRNTILQQLELPAHQVDQQTIRDKVEPLLRANVTRVRATNIAKVADESFRGRLIGSALVHDSVRLERESMWQMVTKFHPFIADQYEFTRTLPDRLQNRVEELRSEMADLQRNNAALLSEYQHESEKHSNLCSQNQLLMTELTQQVEASYMNNVRPLSSGGLVDGTGSQADRNEEQRSSVLLDQSGGNDSRKRQREW